MFSAHWYESVKPLQYSFYLPASIVLAMRKQLFWTEWYTMRMWFSAKREYYQSCSVLDCATQCSQSAAHLCQQFLQVKQIGFVHWDPYAMHRGGCLELYYCNMMEWFCWDSSLIFDDQLVSFSALTLLVWSSGL